MCEFDCEIEIEMFLFSEQTLDRKEWWEFFFICVDRIL